MKQGVVSIRQSPVNGLRWLLLLKCGHVLWITAKTRPTRKTADCGLKH